MTLAAAPSRAAGGGPRAEGLTLTGSALTQLRAAVVAAPRGAERLRLTVAADAGAPLAWLRAVPARVPAAYFAGRDGDGEVLGIGEAEVATAAGAALAPPAWRYAGVLRFEDGPDAKRFAVPLVEIGRARGRAWVAAYLVGPAELARRRVLALLDRLGAAGPPGAAAAAENLVVRRTERPDRAGWDAMMARALAAIDAGAVGKVVLARRVELTLAAPLDAVAVLERLAAREPRSFRFAFRRGASTFVGASPERLFARRGREVVSDAVAGTRRRGVDAAADRAIGAELLTADKDRREHAFVADAVARSLATVCDAVSRDAEPTIMTLGGLLHMHTTAAGGLRLGGDDGALLGALHPTPATCGWPAAAARTFLAAVEPFARGSYAAPVGWIGRDGAELAVGIRAVELCGRTAALTAGAGIVRGSDAAAEWAETEAKLAGVLAALAAGP